MDKIKVAQLTSAHKDGDIRIFHKECVSLAEAGYDVTHIVPNTEDRIVKGVKIISVQSDVKSRFSRMKDTVAEVYKKALEIDADIYHIHDPELLRIALKLKRKGKKVIYDSHEDTPRQILSKAYLNKFVRKFVSIAFETYENFVCKRLTAIVTATPFIKERFIKINKNCINVSNFPLTQEIIKTEIPSKNGLNNVCYIGGITLVRGIEQMIIAAEKSDINLLIAGQWSEEIRSKMIKLKGWDNVEELGYCSREELLTVKNRSIAGIVVLLPAPNHTDSYPIKMFEYMAAGLPIICSNFPLWKSIVATNNCGVCVNPEDPTSIAEAIIYFRENPEIAREMGMNGRKLVREVCNWDIEKKKLLSLYDTISADIRLARSSK